MFVLLLFQHEHGRCLQLFILEKIPQYCALVSDQLALHLCDTAVEADRFGDYLRLLYEAVSNQAMEERGLVVEDS